MYGTCLFCHHPLGANEEIERFPVGRRLAFDASKGRLWVVCPYCVRWNLSPLEERWEAVEACERRFRESPLRASTDNIGLTRLPGGLELVRVGRAQRPELALWRYGRRFRWRRRASVVRHAAVEVAEAADDHLPLIILAASGGTVVSVFGSPILAVLGIGAVSGIVTGTIGRVLSKRTVMRLRDDTTGRLLAVRARDLRAVELTPAATKDGWDLRVAHRDGTSTLSGPGAVRAVGVLLARVNHSGAEDHEIRIAARRLAALPDPLAAFGLAVGHRDALLDVDTAKRWQRLMQARDEDADGDYATRDRRETSANALVRYPKSIRIALEMAAHEESERRAMEGELAALEAEWREAEQIAAIADDLLLPPSVEEWLRRHRLR